MDEVLTEEEWALSQVIAHPVLFREFVNIEDPNWTPLEEHERAWSTCTSPFVVMCCGRSVHKTTSMIEMLYWWMINDMFIPGDQGLFVLVPNKAQKDLSFFRIRQACEKHWLIRHFVETDGINISEGRIDFVSGFQFLIRLTGQSGKEANIIGVHTYRIWVDEAQDVPWQPWQSLQNSYKEEIPGHQLFVSGVPNGMRSLNVLYETDNAEKFNSYNISQSKMSWWTPEMEYAKRKQYHALQEDSEDYKHYILGQHGVPTFTVFDRARFLLEDYESEKIVINQHMIEGTKRTDSDGITRYHINEVVICPQVPIQYGVAPLIGVGYDVGFSPDPTVFMILYLEPVSNHWRILVRIVLERVEYAIQRQIFAWLDTVYGFNFLGIDMGGPGKVQYQDLAGELNAFPDHKFMQRLFPMEFGGYITVAIDEQGVEKKDQAKRVAVETLSRWIHEHRLAIAKTDEDLIVELERTKFSRTMTGEPVYRTEDDHQMAALMCAIMAYEHKFGPSVVTEKPEIKVKLLSAHWMDNPHYGVN